MAIKVDDLDARDWQGMHRIGATAHEPWELDLERWAEQPERLPRTSTIRKLRLRFMDPNP